MVEHLTFNQGVPGSIPGGPTTNRDAICDLGWLIAERGVAQRDVAIVRVVSQHETPDITGLNVPIVQRPRTRPFQG